MTATASIHLRELVQHYAQTHLDVTVADIATHAPCPPSEARYELDALTRDGYLIRDSRTDVYAWKRTENKAQ